MIGYISSWDQWTSLSASRSRASTYLATINIYLVSYLIGFVLGLMGVFMGSGEQAVEIIAMVLGLPFMVMAFIVFGQRFRDMGRSPWWTLTTIIPFVALWPLLSRGQGVSESSPKQILWTKIWIGFSVIFMVGMMLIFGLAL